MMKVFTINELTIMFIVYIVIIIAAQVYQHFYPDYDTDYDYYDDNNYID